jgi:hypothetical protein
MLRTTDQTVKDNLAERQGYGLGHTAEQWNLYRMAGNGEEAVGGQAARNQSRTAPPHARAGPVRR